MTIKLGEDTLMISTPKVCSRCGRATCEYYRAGEHRFLCPECKYELNPPKLTLQVLVNKLYKDGILYNPSSAAYEKDFTLADFNSCGWFVREIIKFKIESALLNTSQVQELVSMEFYGRMRCRRFPAYNFYPRKFKMCENTQCAMASKFNNPNELRYY